MKVLQAPVWALVLAGTAAAQSESSAEELSTIPVQAQAGEAAPAEVAEEAPIAISEIVVTATKREENPRDLPTTVTALSGEDLEQKGYQGQEDFLKLLPGVTFTNDQVTANRITIRGIGADLNTSNTTGVFIGDVPFEDPTLPRVTLDPNPFDLARIEVLKGPQGTLFGGSALNGAVRYVPQEPRLGTFEVKSYVQVENVYEGDLGPTYGAAVNVPLGETVAFRIMGFDRNSPGWVDDEQRDLDDVNETNQHGARAMARWEPTENWKLSLMGIYQKTKFEDSSITDNRDGDLSRSNTPQESPVKTRYDLETLGIQYSFDTFDVLSQTSRTSKHFDGVVDASRIANLMDMPPPSVTITNDNQSRSWMQELRFTSNAGTDDRWKWLGGAFYRDVHMTEVTDILASSLELPIPDAVLQAFAALVPGFNGIITEQGQLNTARGSAEPVDVKEMALFGETTVTLWESVEATLGLRAFRTVSDSRVVFSGVLGSNPTGGNGFPVAVREGRLTDEGLNPHVALKYTFNEHASIYASAAKGFRFGGAQVLVGTFTSQSPDFYQSDTLWSYEIGLRTQWFDDTLIADITPYQLDWKDPQLQQADATGLGSYFDNVGGARSRGVEVALAWATPLRGLTLSFGAAYTDTVTTKHFTTSSGVETEPGTRWPLAAKWQTASTLNYQHRLFGNWTGGGSLIYTTISSAPNTLAYLDTVFGYETLDVTLNLANPALFGMPELSLTLANATDERGILSGVNNPQFAKDHNYIRPRTLVARLAFSF